MEGFCGPEFVESVGWTDVDTEWDGPGGPTMLLPPELLLVAMPFIEVIEFIEVMDMLLMVVANGPGLTLEWEWDTTLLVVTVLVLECAGVCGAG